MLHTGKISEVCVHCNYTAAFSRTSARAVVRNTRGLRRPPVSSCHWIPNQGAQTRARGRQHGPQRAREALAPSPCPRTVALGTQQADETRWRRMFLRTGWTALMHLPGGTMAVTVRSVGKEALPKVGDVAQPLRHHPLLPAEWEAAQTHKTDQHGRLHPTNTGGEWGSTGNPSRKQTRQEGTTKSQTSARGLGIQDAQRMRTETNTRATGTYPQQ